MLFGGARSHPRTRAIYKCALGGVILAAGPVPGQLAAGDRLVI